MGRTARTNRVDQVAYDAIDGAAETACDATTITPVMETLRTGFGTPRKATNQAGRAAQVQPGNVAYRTDGTDKARPSQPQLEEPRQ